MEPTQGQLDDQIVRDPDKGLTEDALRAMGLLPEQAQAVLAKFNQTVDETHRSLQGDYTRKRQRDAQWEEQLRQAQLQLQQRQQELEYREAQLAGMPQNQADPYQDSSYSDPYGEQQGNQDLEATVQAMIKKTMKPAFEAIYWLVEERKRDDDLGSLASKDPEATGLMDDVRAELNKSPNLTPEQAMLIVKGRRASDAPKKDPAKPADVPVVPLRPQPNDIDVIASEPPRPAGDEPLVIPKFSNMTEALSHAMKAMPTGFPSELRNDPRAPGVVATMGPAE